MKKRLILLAGLGVGYVLGSRTGRQSYEKLKAQLQELWTDPKVQETVEKANQSIREKAPAVADAVQTATDKVTAAAQELDGDEDTHGTPGTGSRSTRSTTGPGSTGGPGSSASTTGPGSTSSTTGPTTGATGAGSTGPGSTRSTSGPGSTSSTTGPGSTASTTGPGSTGASRPGTPSPTPGPKPTPTPKRADDVITDPSRSIEDEGPAASANR